MCMHNSLHSIHKRAESEMKKKHTQKNTKGHFSRVSIFLEQKTSR